MNPAIFEHFTTHIGVVSRPASPSQSAQLAQYRVEDTARALVALLSAPTYDPDTDRLVRIYLDFLRDSQDRSGTVIDIRNGDGSWSGSPSAGVAWGSAMWAWGAAVRWSRDADLAAAAYDRFCQSAPQRPTELRPMTFASMGAVHIVEALPGNETAMRLLRRTLAQQDKPTERVGAWPEPSLRDSNGTIAEMMMLAGFHTDRPDAFRRGRMALQWLWDLQNVAGRLSMIPAHGWQRGDALPAFDQRPSEVAALVGACATAYDLTSDPVWRDRAIIGRRWFDGHNDQGIPMIDDRTGGVFAALTANGRSDRLCARATIAYLGVTARTVGMLQAVG